MSYNVMGTRNKTAVMKESKNGHPYWLIGFSDKTTGKAYTLKIFANSSYVPTNSKKSFRNGQTCCPVIITASKYVKDSANGGWNNNGYGGNYNNKQSW